MKNLLKSGIFAFIIAAAFAVNVNAQFGNILDKAKEKVDKKTNQTTNQSQTSNTNNDDARWDLYKCKPEYVGAVNENKLREIIKYNMSNDWGNGGVVIFTKQPLTKSNPTLADSVMTFKAGEPIYMTVVMREALEIDSSGIFVSTSGDAVMTVGDYQKQCEQGYFKNTLYIEYGRFDKMLPQVFSLDFQPADGKSVKYQQQIKFIAQSLNNLKLGIHIIPVRLGSNSESLGVGMFYYDNREGKADDKIINNGLAQIKMPTANPKFATLEKQMVAELNKLGGEGRALRAVVTDEDWTPLRNEYSGVLVGRVISATMAIKNGDGSCYQEKQTWTQDYNGSTYVNLRLNGTREAQDMACENVMK